MPEPDSIAPNAPLDPHALLGDAAATLDAHGRVRGWNAAAATRFGISPADAVGRTLEGLGAAGSDPSLARLPLARGGTLAVWHADEPPGDEQILLAKVRALEFLAGPVKHDLSNPLNALLLFASLVRLEGGLPEDMAGHVEAVADAATRVHRLMSLDLELTRHRPEVVVPVRPATLAAEVLDLAGYLLVDVDTAVDVPDGLPDAEGDPSGVRLALMLVVLNAVRGMGGTKARGRLRITGHVKERGDGVEIVVADDAALIADEERRHLFDALAPVRGGRAGADLAAARALLRRHGGDLRFETGLDDSNRFVVVVPQVGRDIGALDLGSPADQETVPQDDQAPTASTDAASATSGQGASATSGQGAAPATVGRGRDAVLICDDEASMRALIGRVVERAGLRAIEAGSGEDALRQLDREHVVLVIADQHMTEMTGTDLYSIASRRHPDLASRFVLMTGDATDAALVVFADEHRLKVLAKPFELGMVTRLVNEALGHEAPA